MSAQIPNLNLQFVVGQRSAILGFCQDAVELGEISPLGSKVKAVTDVPGRKLGRQRQSHDLIDSRILLGCGFLREFGEKIRDVC